MTEERFTSQKHIARNESDIRQSYFNVFQVKADQEKFMLLFGSNPKEHDISGPLEVTLDTQVILSPSAAGRFALQLNQAVNEFESRFGFIDGKNIIQDKLIPTPPLEIPCFKSVKGKHKAGLLFDFLRDSNINASFERSFELLPETLIDNRFLMGFDKNLLNSETIKELLKICEQMGMPESFLNSITESIQSANVILFGFSEHEGTCLIKAYLEFGYGYYRSLRENPRMPEPYLSHLGFKWDAEETGKSALARYICHPGMNSGDIKKHLANSVYKGENRTVFQCVRKILDLASKKTAVSNLLYLDVREDDNPRLSFDVNLYSADIRLIEIREIVLEICSYLNIPMDRIRKLMSSAHNSILGHIAGGLDREGREFFTFYYGDQHEETEMRRKRD